MENRLYLQALLLLLLLLLSLGMRSTDGSPITCAATTTIYETSVTCYFGIDLSRTNHNFNVQFYFPNLEADPEDVLMCNWKTATDTLCKKTDVISVSNITTQVMLRRPQSINMTRGKYVCQLVPSVEGVTSEPCDLTFREVKITQPQRTTTTTTQSPMLGEIRDTVMKSYAISCVALVISLIILITFITYIFKDRITGMIGGLRKPRQGREGDAESPGDVPMTDKPEEAEAFLQHQFVRQPRLQTVQVAVDTGNDDGLPTDPKKKEKKSFFGSGKKKDSSTPEDKSKTLPDPQPPVPANQNPPAATAGARSLTQSIESTGSAGECRPETKKERKQREKEEKDQREKERKKQEKERKKQEKEKRNNQK